MALYPYLRPLLFESTRYDPEQAHKAAIWALKQAQKSDVILRMLENMHRMNLSGEGVDLLGIRFPNRVGIAAGFDKNAEGIPGLQSLGLGFIEVGTVTTAPQPGNTKVRIRRFPIEEGLINSMGFPSDGYRVFKENIESVKDAIRVPLGINIGINARTLAYDAATEYAELASKLCSYGDYLTINVSSPNTPELTRLQEPEYLESLVHGVVVADESCRRRIGKSPRPIFVKISLDLSDEAVTQVVQILVEAGARGIIIGNTRAHFRPDTLPSGASLQGGYSGPQNFDRALSLVRLVKAMKTNLVIIAAGGIDSGVRARKIIDAGADLIQIYTALIYKGLPLINECRRSLV